MNEWIISEVSRKILKLNFIWYNLYDNKEKEKIFFYFLLIYRSLID